MGRVRLTAVCQEHRHPGRRVALGLLGFALAALVWLAGAGGAAAVCAFRPALTPASDTGLSSNDGLTRDSSPTFTGLVDTGSCQFPFVPAAGVQVTLQRKLDRFFPPSSFTNVATTASGADGRWTAEDPNPGAGSYLYRVLLPATQTTSLPPGTPVIIDLGITPSPSAPDMAPASDTGDVADDDVTSDATPTFTGTTEPGASVQLRRAGVPVGAPVTALPDTTYAITDPGAPDGGALYTVVASDAAGNTDPSLGLTVSIDTDPPAPPGAPNLTAGSDSGASDADDTTNDTTPTLAGTAGPTDPTRPVQLLRDGALVAVAAPVGGAWTASDPGPVPDGGHAYTARVSDPAGNVATSTPLALVIDTRASVSVPDLDPGSDTGASNADDLTRSTAPAFAGTAEPGAAVTLQRDGAALASVVTPSGAWALADPGPAPEGTRSYLAVTVDRAGNQATSAARPVTIDTIAPAAAAPDLDSGSDTGASGSDDVTADLSPTFAGSAEAGAGVQLLRDGIAVGEAVAAAPAWSATDAGPAPLGVNLYTVRITDPAGNAGTSGPLSVSIDTQAPGPPAISGPADGARLRAVPAFTITPEPGASASWALAGPSPRAGEGTAPDLTGIAAGAYVLSGVATDAAGNRSRAATRSFTLGPPPVAVDLRVARVSGSWRRSRFSGALLLVGRAPVAALLEVTLRSPRSRQPAVRRRLAVRRGAFRLSPRLPARIVPGPYLVEVAGRAAGRPVVAPVRRVVIPTPPEGVAFQAFISARQSGPPATRLAGSPREVFATFRFAALPRRGRAVSVTWFAPRGAAVASAGKPRRSLVQAFVSSGTGLDRGRWRAVLRAGGVVVAEASVVLG